MTMPQDPFKHPGSPAIWIYAQEALDVTVKLSFGNDGFMTNSTPDYNEGWRINVDPKSPFYRYTPLFGEDQSSYAFLDYDGFRGGDFQKTSGWCIKQGDLLSWQRTQLSELGFTMSEIDDVNYTYGRMLLERRYRDEYFAVYPQDAKVVEASVGIEMSPRPQSTYRLWLYFVPVPRKLELPRPQLAPVRRNGLTLVELAYLTDREIPKVGRMLSVRSGTEVHDTLR